MTNETMGRNKFTPAGLLDIAKQIKTNRKSVDDLEDRLHSALDAKRDVASNYVEKLDAIASEKEVEVKLDPITDLIQTTVKTNDAVYLAGFDAGYEKGDWKGYNSGRLHGELDLNEEAVSKDHSESLDRIFGTSEQRDRELLEEHGIDVDGFCDKVVKMVEDHEKS